jgi:opacity protein-like surface antigen
MRAAAVLGLAGLLFANEAMAADYLRGTTYEGPTESYNWAGVYIGGQVGYTGADFNFGSATQSQVADILRSTLLENEAQASKLPKLSNGSANGTSYGGFVGYNAQWGEAVVGFEANYSHTSILKTANDLISRSFTTSDNFRNDITIISNASARLTDFATLRARAGYAAGPFMPYMMAGLAVGVVDYSRSATVNLTGTDVSPSAQDPNDGIPPRPGYTLVDSRTDAKNGAIAFGYMFGAGIDIGLLPNLFVRGEYEWVQFIPVGGIEIQTNTFRTALALKF